MNALLACDWQRFVNYDLPVLLWGIIILGSLLIILKMLKPVIKEYLRQFGIKKSHKKLVI